MRTSPTFSNCHFGLLYLLLRGTATKVVFAPGGNWLIPWHVGIITRRGHYLHFYRLLPHEQNTYGAWWFLGSFQGLRRSVWPVWIGQRGACSLLKPLIVLPIWLTGYLCLFLPWCLAWSLYGPLWSLYWGYLGWRRRRADR